MGVIIFQKGEVGHFCRPSGFRGVWDFKVLKFIYPDLGRSQGLGPCLLGSWPWHRAFAGAKNSTFSETF